jgi:tRNA pseudouridine55 synthase
MISGWLLLDKPYGISSNCALQKVKKILNIKKAGYAGTLDPLATGILPVVLNEATKALYYVTHDHKSYRFQIHFGCERTTGDLEGEVCATSSYLPSPQEIETSLPIFKGTIDQIPPHYSAIKIDGKRAYDLARKNEIFEIPSRKITIYNLKMITMDDKEHATFEVTCSSGTYVRSLAMDIARRAKSCGYVSMLRRTSYGGFDSQKAITLEKLIELFQNISYSEACVKCILPITTGLDDIPAVGVTDLEYDALIKGQTIVLSQVYDFIKENLTVKLMRNQQLIGFGTIRYNRYLQPIRLINNGE